MYGLVDFSDTAMIGQIIVFNKMKSFDHFYFP